VNSRREPYDEEIEILCRDIDRKTLERKEIRSYKTKFHAKFVGTKTVKRPKAYIIPQSMSTVIDKLKLHDIQISILDSDKELVVTAYTISKITESECPDHGHLKRMEFKMEVETTKIKKRFTKGDVMVDPSQRQGNLAVYLLEPESDDGLGTWGFLGTIKGKELDIYRLE
jgi:hypothetical protein